MKLIFTFLLLLSTQIYSSNEVALTFDDLPGFPDESAEKLSDINNQIFKTLHKFQAPAIGFVNEYKLYSKGETKAKTAILQSWIDNGFVLGNHTFSHHALSKSKITDYEADVIKGATVSKKLMQDANLEYKYFRYPYLDTGKKPTIHLAFVNFLHEQGYTIAPVTIDTSDWKFNRSLLKKPEDKDTIIKKYLAFTRQQFAFYEKASNKIFKRNIKQVWLLHVNLLNSYVLEDLLKIAKEFDYDFVTLDKVLKDMAYLESNNYYALSGAPATWLRHWDITHDKVVDWSQQPEPDLSPTNAIENNKIKLADKN